MQKVKIICVMKSGGDFDADDVKNLSCMVDDNLSCDYEFICYSDIDDVADVKLEYGLRGWWSKVEIFKETGPCIFLDLDTAIFGDLTDIARHILKANNEFLMLSPFNKRNREKGIYASGVMAWNGDFSYILNEYPHEHNMRMDQVYITQKLKEHGANLKYVNDVFKGIVSYRWHCQQAIPDTASLVCFHGKPRPRKVGMPFWGYHLNN